MLSVAEEIKNEKLKKCYVEVVDTLLTKWRELLMMLRCSNSCVILFVSISDHSLSRLDKLLLLDINVAFAITLVDF